MLKPILFCVVCLGFQPRIATESSDSGENRLDKIQRLIVGSKYSIHDLSRCAAKYAGELFRLNMPFELGIDQGCRKFFGHGRAQKKFLILDEGKYRYQAAISDLSGCDIESHQGNFETAVRKVRNWLVSEAGAASRAAAKILQDYADFLEWHIRENTAAGHSQEDILDFPTSELLVSMQKWNDTEIMI